MRAMFMHRVLCAISLCIGVISTTSPGHTADKCDIRVLPGDSKDPDNFGADEQWIFSGRNERCEAKRLVPSGADCDISVEFQHGTQHFGCKNGVHGYWGSHSMRFFGMAITTMSASRKVELPEHRELRGAWLAPVDTEGLHIGYPISGDDYIDNYPRRFTKIGAKTEVPNPMLGAATQSLHYETMKGDARAAVTGEVAYGCLKIHFISWVAPDAAPATEEKLASFLRGLRLEPVDLTRLNEENRKAVCAPPDPKK